MLRFSRDQLGHSRGPTDSINGRTIGYPCKNDLKAVSKYNSEFRDCYDGIILNLKIAL